MRELIQVNPLGPLGHSAYQDLTCWKLLSKFELITYHASTLFAFTNSDYSDRTRSGTQRAQVVSVDNILLAHLRPSNST